MVLFSQEAILFPVTGKNPNDAHTDIGKEDTK